MAKKSKTARKKPATRARATRPARPRKAKAAAVKRPAASARALRTATTASLDEALDAVRTFASSQAAAGKPTGACLIPNPLGGRTCVMVDRDTCKLMKGTFVGGQCL
jgi:hypothetical protein